MNIRVFGLPNCPQCNLVKSFLTLKSVDFSYEIVGKDIEKEDLDALIGRVAKQAPVIVVDGKECTIMELKNKVEMSELTLTDI